MDKDKEFFEMIGRPLLDDLEEGGITRKILVKKLKEELEATETKGFCYNGEILHDDPKPAWEIRQRARMDVQKLLNLYPPEKHDYFLQANTPPVHSLEEREELLAISRKVYEEVRAQKRAMVELPNKTEKSEETE